MSGIIEGYNYDIFISYRQKDNKHDGWVTEFANNLTGELEATFKEEISVYFDINPHDGLLETHDVDASLKEKLKCLIFIPIISRTYCDPKSFAWEHEFKAFVELASNDQFGLKIKLPNGNVASRVLPVRIHDLDYDDIRECESVLGSVLRGIEFVYKEAGVDKPLAPEDDEKKNLNKTKYKIQIIKVAHAIKEIIAGMKGEPVQAERIEGLRERKIKKVTEDGNKVEAEKPAKSIRYSWLLTGAAFVLFIIAGILLYPKLFKKDNLAKLRSSGDRISVAVLPFQNMTDDTVWNVWQDGIQDILITSLSNSEELKVRQTESINSLVKGQGIVNYASMTPTVASTISQKLDASVMIYGSIKQAGNKTRLYAQLIDPETEEVFKSFQIEGLDKEEQIFNLIDSLSLMVKNFLIISNLKKSDVAYYRYLVTTSSPEAYRYFVQGRDEYAKWNFPAALNWLSKAIAIDSNFFQAILMTSLAYGNQSEYETSFSSTNESLFLLEQGKKWCLRAYAKIDQMPYQLKLNTNWAYANFFGTPYDRIKYLKQLIEFDDQLTIAYFNLGSCYYDLLQYDKAIPEYKKTLEIFKKWGIKPFWVFDYAYLGEIYYKTGQYKKAAKIFKEAERYFSDDVQLIGRQAILSLYRGDTVEANRFIDRLVTGLRNMSIPEANVMSVLAMIYNEAALPGEAERFYRKALFLDPGNPDKINSLAFLLIDRGRNINEGLILAEEALRLSPDNFYYLDTKGWGLYKQGKFEEALEILQKSWDLRREKAVYDHEAYLHLEAAKKAVAG